MADMKEYIVWVNHTNDIYLVSAKDTKDAINQIWEEVQVDNQVEGCVQICKEDITARSVGSLHNQQGKVVMLF